MNSTFNPDIVKEYGKEYGKLYDLNNPISEKIYTVNISGSKKKYLNKKDYKIIKQNGNNILLKRRNNIITIKSSDEL